MKRCFIFSAGSFYSLYEKPQDGDLVIAADAGLLLCKELQINPDYVMGDFDSMDFPFSAANVITLKVAGYMGTMILGNSVGSIIISLYDKLRIKPRFPVAQKEQFTAQPT